VNFIAHRRNTICQLQDTDKKYGVEVDIRSNDNELIIHHDPFCAGEPFKNWIKEFKHGTLILNVKEEGLENPLLEIMNDSNITDFFFLDQSFPFLIKTANSGESRCAIRISEFESCETAFSLAGKIDWAWIDFFSEFPLTNADYQKLKDGGYKLCIVSPELQGRKSTQEIPRLAELLSDRGILVDAVCSKRIDIWEELFR